MDKLKLMDINVDEIELMPTCDVCDCLLTEDEMDVYNVDDVAHCETCFYETYTHCEHCGEIVENSEIISVDDDETYVCSRCANNNYYQCDDCGGFYSHTYSTYDGWNSYCESCSENHPSQYEDEDEDDDDSTVYWDCSNVFTPQTVRIESNPIGRGNRYFGFELESECSQRALAIREMQGTPDFSNVFTFKSDCSLDAFDGFEMVSQPLTMGRWSEVAPLLQKGFDIQKDNGVYTSGQAGTHVHVNRESFGVDEMEIEFTTGKVIVLFNYLWDAFFKQISRREWRYGTGENTPFSYSKHNAQLSLSMDVSREANVFRFYNAFREYKAYNRDRYVAVNLQPSRTVEFRLFGHLTSSDDCLAVVELLDKVIEFARLSTLKQCYDIRDYKRLFRDAPASANLIRFIEGGLNV